MMPKAGVLPTTNPVININIITREQRRPVGTFRGIPQGPRRWNEGHCWLKGKDWPHGSQLEGSQHPEGK